MEPKIMINGKEVSTLNDLPDGLKNILGDGNKNGIPDIAENPFALLGKLGDLKDLGKNIGMGSIPQIFQMLQTGKIDNVIKKININGQTYDSWDQVPEDLKMKLKAKMGQLKQKSGTVSEQISFTPAQSTSSAVSSITQTAPKKIQPPSLMTNPVRPGHEAGRNFLLILALVGLAGWLIYQYMLTGS